ncbi:MAG: hypothetical protein ACKOF7_12590 [Phycisphaerales bacterium]
MDALAGIFALDKPIGMTSMQAVALVRRRAGGARTGHAGTLDPLATGVLVIALGKCTRQIESLMATDKRYETVIDLSAFTTTDDIEGPRTAGVPGACAARAAPHQRDRLQAGHADRLVEREDAGKCVHRPRKLRAVEGASARG